MTVYACSSNPCKLGELIRGARRSGLLEVTIEALPGIQQIPPPDETGSSFEENASSKALYYSGFTNQLVVADDSGLEVAALNGAPGIYSARYAGPNSTDAANNELLLRRLESQKDRAARFVCFLALARAGKLIMTIPGIAEGEILTEPRGSEGFGYDPLFLYPPLARTFAELTPDEKLTVSHRGKALRSLFNYLAGSSTGRTAISDKIG